MKKQILIRVSVAIVGLALCVVAWNNPFLGLKPEGILGITLILGAGLF